MLYKGTIIKSHKKDISHSIYNYPQKKDYNSHSGILFSSHEKIHSIIFTDKDKSKKRSFVTTPYITLTLLTLPKVVLVVTETLLYLP